MVNIKKIITVFMAFALLLAPISVLGAEERQAGSEYNGVDIDSFFTKHEIIVKGASEAFTDVDDNMVNTVGLLNKLGIMKGYADNTFKPEQLMTRGEFAGIVVKLLKLSDKEAPSGSFGTFYDVPSGHEYENAIYILKNINIVTGYEPGYFGPDRSIGYDEAVIMLLRVLGYDAHAEVKGGMNTGYIMKASELGLTSGITVENRTALTRGEIARLVYKALDIPLMKVDSYGDSYTYSSYKNQTILTEYFDIYHDIGIVEATSITAKDGKPVAAGGIMIKGVRYNSEPKYDSFLGYRVKYYYSDIEGEVKIEYMNTHMVNEITISADDFRGVDASGRIEYEENDKLRYISVDPLFTGILNGKYVNVNDLYGFLLINTGSITLVSNDDNFTYEVIFVNRYENIVVDSVKYDGTDILITPRHNLRTIKASFGRNEERLDIYGDSGKIEYIKVIANSFDEFGNPNTTVDLSALSSGTVVSIFSDSYIEQAGHYLPDENAAYLLLRVTKRTVNGTITEINETDREVSIEGDTYKISKSNYFDQKGAQIELGKTGRFYLDYENELVDFEGGSSLGYGYLIGAHKKEALNEELDMKILTYDGSIEVYKSTKKPELNGVRRDADSVLALLKATAVLLRDNFTISQMIKYKLNSENQVDIIQTVTKDIGIESGYGTDHLNRYALPSKYSTKEEPYAHGRLQDIQASITGDIFHFQRPLKYFTVPAEESFNDDDYYTDRSPYLFSDLVLEFYDVDEVFQPAIALEYADGSSSGLKDILTSRGRAYPVMVEKVFTTLDDKGNTVSALIALTGEGTKTYYGETADVFNGCTIGQVINLKAKKGSIISEYEQVKYHDVPIKPQSIYNPDNHFAIDSSSALPVFGELYYMKENMLVLQAGPVIDAATGKRAYQFISTMRLDDAGFQSGGALMYDSSNNKSKPLIRSCTLLDMKTVCRDGAENASMIYIKPQNGGAHQVIVFNQ